MRRHPRAAALHKLGTHPLRSFLVPGETSWCRGRRQQNTASCDDRQHRALWRSLIRQRPRFRSRRRQRPRFGSRAPLRRQRLRPRSFGHAVAPRVGGVHCLGKCAGFCRLPGANARARPAPASDMQTNFHHADSRAHTPAGFDDAFWHPLGDVREPSGQAYAAGHRTMSTRIADDW